MIDALEFRKHRVASAVFVALNALAAIIWVVGLILVTVSLVAPDPASQIIPANGPAPYNQRAPASYNVPISSLTATINAIYSGPPRAVVTANLFICYLFAGLLCLALAQIVRYMAAIAEATGKHASAYLDVVSSHHTPKP